MKYLKTQLIQIIHRPKQISVYIKNILLKINYKTFFKYVLTVLFILLHFFTHCTTILIILIQNIFISYLNYINSSSKYI